MQKSKNYVGIDYANQRFDSFVNTAGNYYSSCWIMKEIESFLMWKNYSNYKEGLLLFSTVGKLLNSLNLISADNNDQIVNWYYGEVDYGPTKLMASDHVRAFGKKKFFEGEKEFRIVRYNHPALVENYIYADIKNFKFIDKVICSPGSSNEFMKLIKKFMIEYGLNDSIVHTSEIKIDKEEISEMLKSQLSI